MVIASAISRWFMRVAECLRRADESGRHVVARLGGEEFAALQFNATSATAAEAADAGPSRSVAARLIAHGRRRASVSISVGVAGAQTATTGLADLLERADAALYAAKRAGRNCVVVDGAPLSAAMSDPMPRASAGFDATGGPAENGKIIEIIVGLSRARASLGRNDPTRRG